MRPGRGIPQRRKNLPERRTKGVTLKKSAILRTEIALRRKYLPERRTSIIPKRGTIPEKGSTPRIENTPKRGINLEGGTIQRKRGTTHEVGSTQRRVNLTEVQEKVREVTD